VDDQDWKDAIRFFLKRSSLVVIVVGRSTSLWWEIAESLRTSPPERLLFAFPLAIPSITERQSKARGLRRWFVYQLSDSDIQVANAERNARYELFRNRIASVVSLPNVLANHQFLAFDNGWNPVFLEEKENWLALFSNRSSLDVSFRRTLRPIVQRARK
jgi:hypothetical protein